MGRSLTYILVAIFAVGCYNSFDPLDADELISRDCYANTTIKHLHSLYSGGTREINEDLVVEGVVTANDEYGNFFKSFVIEEDGYALEILDGLYDSYVNHPIGSSVVIRLNGLTLDRYLGVLRTGVAAGATSSYTLDYMSSLAVVDYYIDVVEFGSTPSPTAMALSDLSGEISGRFIRLNTMQLLTEDGVERSWSGYALFRNVEQDSIWCYTSSYADFAASKIPQDVVSLCGILEFGDTDSFADQFIIKLRGEEDCIY